MSRSPRVRAREIVSEALSGIGSRPARTALTVLGTVLGIGTLVTTLGVSATAGNQIAARFDAATATEVTITVPVPENTERLPPVPWTALDNLSRLNGVTAASGYARSRSGNELPVRSTALHDPTRVSTRKLTVIATDVAFPAAARTAVTTGRFFDRGHVTRHDRVAVLGPEAAEQLGVTRVDQQPAIFVDDQSFSVIGILGPSTRTDQTLLNSAIVVPWSTAETTLRAGPIDTVLVTTALGAAPLVAEQAPVALSPNDPLALQVSAPPDPADLRTGVAQDVSGMLLVLGLVSLVVGALGIANVTLVTVIERTAEIGLRRALGARRRHIAAQFLGESVFVGLLGGVIGASLGILAVVTISVVRNWTPVVDGWLAAGAPAAGAVVGLVAGLYPAFRAASMQPVDALRGPA
uniref:ABC transporter permease n=1 Tax=Paractinoplanes polyasparticus TaxID=2856853 RepID=UPI001C853CDC|nr:ABC transporter permease [Actinoplanes polyasparticus]